MLEYIILTASVDEAFNNLLNEVIAGKVKELAPAKIIPGSGLEPPVSVPKKPDNKAYIDALNSDEKKIFNLYQDIIDNKKEVGLE